MSDDEDRSSEMEVTLEPASPEQLQELEQCKADFIRLQDALDLLRVHARTLKKEQNTYKAKIIEHMKATQQTVMIFSSIKFEIGSKQVLRMSKDALHALELDDETKSDFLPWVPFTSCKKIKSA